MKRQDLERKYLRVLEKSILDYEAQLFFVSHDDFILNQAIYANFLMKRRFGDQKQLLSKLGTTNS